MSHLARNILSVYYKKCRNKSCIVETPSLYTTRHLAISIYKVTINT